MAEYDRRQSGGGRKRRYRGECSTQHKTYSYCGFSLVSPARPYILHLTSYILPRRSRVSEHQSTGINLPDTDDDEYDRRPQRRRYDAPLPVRLRKQLLGLAESPLRRWHEEVQSIAQIIADNYDDQELQTSFLDLVPQMVLEQPLKIPFVAAVVLVVNSLKPEALDSLLARITSATEGKVKEGEWRDVKLYLKFLACLQGCFEGDGLFPMLDELFSRAVDLQTASSEDVSLDDMFPAYRYPFANGSLLDDWH